MKITYAISVDDFRAFQVPFSRRVGTSVWFKRAVVACSGMAALGIYCIVEGYSRSVAGYFVVLAIVGVALACLYDARSVRRTKQKYERNIGVAYERLHCRERRVVEADEIGFTLACACGATTHKWSELVQLGENDRFFLLRTKTDGVVLPKAAFTSESDQTEFRRLAAEPIHRALAFAARNVELVSGARDYWNARVLHIVEGGGWRQLAPALLLLIGQACILAVFHERRPQGVMEKIVAIETTVMFALVALATVMFVGGRNLRAAYGARLRMYFGEAGLQFQDAVTIGTNPWETYCGYLESRNIYLLYYNAKFYRIIPKRALGSRESEFRELLQRKVSPFDFRYPFRLGPREVLGRPD